MKNYKKIILLAMVGILPFSSCKDMLETEPRQSISSEIALTTSAGVSALLNNIYANYRNTSNYGLNRVLLPEVLADNVINTSTNNNTWRNQELNQPNTGTGAWSDNYGIIHKANLIIDAINANEIKDMTDAQKSQFKGEALALRALAYFQLATSYGYLPGREVGGFNLSVPIILKGTRTLGDIELVPRNTNVEVFARIIADLNEAKTLLTNSGRSGKAYVSKAAAEALLSRVYLYNQDFANTITNANAALATGTIYGKATVVTTSGTALVNHWRAPVDKPESIWDIAFTSTETLGTNSLQSWFSIFPKPVSAACTGQPTRVSFADLRVSQPLLDLYPANDIRKTQLIEGPYCKANQTNLFFSNKYNGTGGAFGLDNVSVIRTSEVLLNRAEAYARSGQTGPALADLNVIRTRAGLPAYVLGSTADLIQEILTQRRLELAFEGHRWFDLLRNGLDIPKAPGGLNTVTSMPYSDRRVLTPVPTAQIDVNPKLVQNPGY